MSPGAPFDRGTLSDKADDLEITILTPSVVAHLQWTSRSGYKDQEGSCSPWLCGLDAAR
jgi:hypothetical protein